MPPLHMRRRHRRRYMGDQQSRIAGLHRRSATRSVIGIGIIVLLLLYAGNWILNRFDAGNTIRRIGTTLTLQESGVASVSIEGSELKRAEDGQKLYPGDRVVTNPASNAQLAFFDGSAVRLDELTDVTITETYEGAKESNLTLRLQEGILWTRTPDFDTYSGTIVRTVDTASMTLTLPSNTEALIQPRSIVVYSAAGIGVTVNVDNGIIPVIVGEGQKFTIPPDVESITDLYAYRSPLDPLAVQLPFVERSRQMVEREDEVEGIEEVEGVESEESGEVLAVLNPEGGEVVDSATINVTGRVGDTVARVRVNGYNAPIENGSFAQELALPDEDEIEITVIALDEGGGTLSEIRRQITRNRTPPEPPTITAPAEDGDTYRTSQERLEISGRAPEGTVGIIVNDYRLQLFEPGDRTWTYLASTAIDNFKPGRNVYKVYALNAGGYKSEPAIIVVELGTGPEGVVDDGEEDTGDIEEVAEPPVDDEAFELPDNAPLQPGIIKVTSPTAGTGHNATEASFLIEGITASNTDSLWINNYKLRLYEAGKETWNYIADVNMNTLKRGTNEYEIIARDENLRILDRFIYTVEFRP